MIDPLEVPDSLDEVGIVDMSVDDGEWRLNEEFSCFACGGPAYCNPYTNRIWGCRNCGFTTTSMSIYFKEAQAA